MGFVRFVLPQRDRDSGLCEGLFQLAYRLCEDPAVDEHDRWAARQILVWFEEKVPIPDRFNRTSSKGFYRRTTRGISWFRDTATECVSRMRELTNILHSYGHQVTMISECRVGYIIYEDDFQVVAEPFSDTDTGATGEIRSS